MRCEVKKQWAIDNGPWALGNAEGVDFLGVGLGGLGIGGLGIGKYKRGLGAIIRGWVRVG
jgi:hypothetical protein